MLLEFLHLVRIRSLRKSLLGFKELRRAVVKAFADHFPMAAYDRLNRAADAVLAVPAIADALARDAKVAEDIVWLAKLAQGSSCEAHAALVECVPGAAPSPTDDRYTRLPKWAQMEMEAMRGEVDYLSARALQNTAGRP